MCSIWQLCKEYSMFSHRYFITFVQILFPQRDDLGLCQIFSHERILCSSHCGFNRVL